MDSDPSQPWPQRSLTERGIAFRGEALPVSRKAYCPAPGELALLARACEALGEAAERVCEAFPQDEALRSLFSYGPLQTECVLKDPGYRPLIPLGRLDSFVLPGGPRFLEYNTDGTAGWHYTSALTALWREGEGLPPEAEPLPERLLRTLLFCFRQWDRRGLERPRMAVVDWAEVGTREEQEALAARFSAQGFPCSVEDPRALRLEKGRLAGPRGPVDLVYRRLVSEEAFSRAQEIRPFLDAYLGDAACFVGGFRTDPAWSKILFVVLSDPSWGRLFSEETKSVLRAAVPWTRKLLQGPLAYAGETAEPLQLLLRHRAELLLKPARGYEGRGVVAGAYCNDSEWRAEAERALAEGGYVVQELVRPEPACSAAGLPSYLQIGEFLLLGRLAGLLVRSSPTPLITPQVTELFHPVGVEVPWTMGRQ
jgi:hypothetical protein